MFQVKRIELSDKKRPSWALYHVAAGRMYGERITAHGKSFTAFGSKKAATAWKNRLEKIENDYLDYFNNYLTVEKFAEDRGIPLAEAQRIINTGRNINQTGSEGQS